MDSRLNARDALMMAFALVFAVSLCVMLSDMLVCAIVPGAELTPWPFASSFVSLVVLVALDD